MIVTATIESDGAIVITLDSDGDQGDGYSTEVIDDMLRRAGIEALALYGSLNPKPTRALPGKKSRKE